MLVYLYIRFTIICLNKVCARSKDSQNSEIQDRELKGKLYHQDHKKYIEAQDSLTNDPYLRIQVAAYL